MRIGENDDGERGLTGEIDLSRILRVLSVKRWWVLGPTLAALAGALIFVNVVKPRYSAEARVLLENQENFLPRADKTERVTEVLPDAEAVQSQIQLLTSRDLARRVIKMLGLQGDDEFDPLAKGMGLTSRTLVLLGLMRDPTQLSPEDRMLETFADKLSVLSPTKTRVLSIEFTSRNPDLAARGANAVAEAYLEFQQQAKRDNARSAAKTLASLVAELRKQVADAEGRAEQFRVKSGLLLGSNNTTINAQHLSDLNTQLSLSRTAQADAQAKARLLRDMLRQNRIGDIPDVANNEVIRRLLEQRVTLRAQLALESRTLLPGHPRIKELQAQLADLDMQGRSAAERTVRTLENEARIAGARVENLTRALDAQKQVVGAADADDVQLRELERTARLYKEQLESATAKYQEALARENAQGTPADARIFQRALAPQMPSFPKKLPITAFATLAALILSTGVILSGEMLSGRAHVTSAKVEPRAKLDAPASFATAAVKDETAWRMTPEKYASDDSQVEGNDPSLGNGVSAKQMTEEASKSEAPSKKVFPREADREIADEREVIGGIDAARLETRCVKVLIASGDSGPAAFNTVLALARGLARRGRAVLVSINENEAIIDQLVTFNDRQPRGLRELVSGLADFGEVIYRDKGSHLHLIPPGLDHGAEQFDVAMVVDALARTYDFVVFSIGATSDVFRFSSMFDKILLRDADPAAHEMFDELSHVHRDVQLIEDATGDLVAA